LIHEKYSPTILFKEEIFFEKRFSLCAVEDGEKFIKRKIKKVIPKIVGIIKTDFFMI
jgi:hypothetical protein